MKGRDTDSQIRMQGQLVEKLERHKQNLCVLKLKILLDGRDRVVICVLVLRWRRKGRGE